MLHLFRLASGRRQRMTGNPIHVLSLIDDVIEMY